MPGEAHYVQWHIEEVPLAAGGIGHGYRVVVYDEEWQPLDEYAGANHPGVSDVYVPDDEGVSILTLIRWAKQTAAEYSNQYGIDADRISHDRDSEADDGMPAMNPGRYPEYHYTDEMPSGDASFSRRCGWVVYDRDGDIWTILPAECEGHAKAITEWLNEPSPWPSLDLIEAPLPGPWKSTYIADNMLVCRECGEIMFIEPEPSGVSHHGGSGAIDHDADADHVAVADKE